MKKIKFTALTALIILLIFALSSCSAEKPDDTEYTYTCRLTVTCEDLIENMNTVPSAKTSLVPENGIILDIDAGFNEGESVLDVLKRELQNKSIHMDVTELPAYNTVYVSAINNLYEKDCGDTSGWMFSVNGEFTSTGCSETKLANGDTVEWAYYHDCTIFW